MWAIYYPCPQHLGIHDSYLYVYESMSYGLSWEIVVGELKMQVHTGIMITFNLSAKLLVFAHTSVKLSNFRTDFSCKFVNQALQSCDIT